MKAILYGIQEIDFTNSNGEKICGYNIYVGFADENVEGQRVGKFFIKDGISLPKDLKLNSELEISFNYKGKVESIHRA